MARTLKRVAYVRRTRRLDELERGYHGKTIDFDWRPYEKRSEKDRKDFDRLVVSIERAGIRDPLITFGDHVLIGQRRHEIGERLGIEEVEVLDITEDISTWGSDDIKRLELLCEEGMWARNQN